MTLRVELLLSTGARLQETAEHPGAVARAVKRLLQSLELSIRPGSPLKAAHRHERHVFDAVAGVQGIRVDLPNGARLVGVCRSGVWTLHVVRPGCSPVVAREFAAPSVRPGQESTYGWKKWLKEPSDSYALRANVLEVLSAMGAP